MAGALGCSKVHINNFIATKHQSSGDTAPDPEQLFRPLLRAGDGRRVRTLKIDTPASPKVERPLWISRSGGGNFLLGPISKKLPTTYLMPQAAAGLRPAAKISLIQHHPRGLPRHYLISRLRRLASTICQHRTGRRYQSATTPSVGAGLRPALRGRDISALVRGYEPSITARLVRISFPHGSRIPLLKWARL